MSEKRKAELRRRAAKRSKARRRFGGGARAIVVDGAVAAFVTSCAHLWNPYDVCIRCGTTRGPQYPVA